MREEYMLNIQQSHETDIRILREKLNIFGLHVHHFFSKKTKRKVGLKIYALEAKENIAEADIFARLKNLYHPEIANFVIESRFPGLVAKYLPFIQDISDYISQYEKLHRLTFLTKKSLSLVSHYADSFKDFYILYIMVNINGGTGTLVEFPLKFSSIVILCMSTTIVGPLLMSSIQLAINNPGLIFNSQRTDKWSVRLMRIGVILLSVFIPILLNVAHENINEVIRNETRKSGGNSKVSELLRKKKEIKQELSRFTRVDLGIELIYQIALQLLLVLLNEKKTPTTGGLEVLFEQASAFGMTGTTLITLTTIWSFKTCIMLQRKVIKTEKGLLPFTSSLVIVFWSIIAAGRRIMTIIVFFLPCLGLFNILSHWKAEQIPFTVRFEAIEDKVMTSGDIIHLNTMKRNVLWTAIDRWEYNQTDLKAHKPPHYSLYTGLALGQVFVTFLILLAFQLIAITLVKKNKIKNVNWFNIFVHNLESLNFPFPYKDWDVDTDLTVAEYKQKLKKVNIEMFWSFVVNIVFNVLMFVPFWWTGMEL